MFFRKRYFVLIVIASIAVLSAYCKSGTKKKTKKHTETVTTDHRYLNLNDTVKYVGINTCKQCHQKIYKTFIHSAMGESFDVASKQKSVAKFGPHQVIYDKYKNFYYHPFWKGDSLEVMEFRLKGRDTTYKRVQYVSYIIGSGMHTNSHMYNINGYVYQIPMTFYAQKGVWDFPPGFSHGFNSRFGRQIGLECMTCHNSYPKFVKGSMNKFKSIPNGITCERCHGPGELHVKSVEAGHIVDTTKAIDYTIVNPAKLPVRLQVDVCERCHLQGNAVLRKGKSFYDFKPGMRLKDVMDVFMPKYTGMKDEFMMASHIARLKMSQCYIQTNRDLKKGADELKPYKDGLTCITCHNPHIDVRLSGDNVFNNVCQSCHGKKVKTVCTDDMADRKKKNNDCVTCHMPKNHTIDIPHVITTDHYIHIPIKKSQIVKVKKFLGLYAVDDSFPSNRVKAWAYINEYSKFGPDHPALLDSAKHFIPDKTVQDVKNNYNALIALYFFKQNYSRIEHYVEVLGQDSLLNYYLTHVTWDNKDAWAAYHIGQAYDELYDLNNALLFYKKAVKLAPYILSFRNKLGALLVKMHKVDKAQKVFDFVLKQNPQYVPALTNMGYIYVLQGDPAEAQKEYSRGLGLNPDYEPLLMNQAGLYIYLKEYDKARNVLETLLKKNPANGQAKQVLRQLNHIRV